MSRTTYRVIAILVASIAIIAVLIIIYSDRIKCKPSITSTSGQAALKEFCSGSLIFEENFDILDKEIWHHEITFWGGENGEFQWYVGEEENSFTKDGKLHIKPTLTSDKIGSYQVENGYISLNDCTDLNKENCYRKAGGNVIINPVRSARLNTKDTFSFKYGRVEVIAKAPLGDWLWPAVRLMPAHDKYGHWPQSGEIDLFESRGNAHYKDVNGTEIGVEQMASTLHFGPDPKQDAFRKALIFKSNNTGFNNGFHKYAFLWDESGIRFFVDDDEFGFISVDDGFWKKGDFNGENIWASGTKMAPFDQEFYFIINLAVGGLTYFPNTDNENGKRPWNDTSETAMKEFWMNQQQWLPSWHFDNDESSFIIDSVKVWAI